jgi:diguanylate cyclase (GGDEF)-like protein
MDAAGGARNESPRPKLLDGVVEALEPGDSAGLGLIVRDLARALGAEMALLAVLDDAGKNVGVLAAWGAAAGPDGLPASLPADGFVGRALQFGRAAVEPIDAETAGLGQPASGEEIARALGVPVTPLSGPRGALCAAFTREPSHDLRTTLWLAESYARVASLCLHDADALDGLLSGGRIDGLTGCLTQAAFLQELRREVARSERHGRPLACSFIDLDRFKRVNDRYGHLHGSRVLASIAAVLRAGIRSEDTLGRYGGDEFVILLPDTDESTALQLSQRLRATITATMINLPHDPIDASIGVAEWRSGSSLQALLGAADEALLVAKAAGGGATIRASTLRSESEEPSGPDRTARDITDADHAASVKDVLEVSAHFEESGGASIELTAWELDVELSRVVSAWSHAIKEGLLEPAGTDPASGEEMWCLSDQGRNARGRER